MSKVSIPTPWSIAQLMFDFCIEKCEWSTSRPSFITGNQPQYPLYRRLSGPHSRYGLYVRRENSFTCRHSIPTPPNSNLVITPSVQSQLPKRWEEQRSKDVYFGAGCMSKNLSHSPCICLLFIIIYLTFVWPYMSSTMILATNKVQQNSFYWFF